MSYRDRPFEPKRKVLFTCTRCGGQCMELTEAEIKEANLAKEQAVQEAKARSVNLIPLAHACGACGMLHMQKGEEYVPYELPENITPITTTADRPSLVQMKRALQDAAGLAFRAYIAKLPVGAKIPNCREDLDEKGMALSKQIEAAFSPSTPEQMEHGPTWADLELGILKSIQAIARFITDSPRK